MLRRYAERALGYYRLYGARRFAWAIGFKLRQRLASGRFLEQRARSPLDPEESFQAFLKQDGVDATVERKAVSVMRKPRVVILGDLNLPQCKKYRVIQKLEGLASAGLSADYSHWEDITRALSAIQLATFVIFFRTRDTAGFQISLKECERLGVPFAYDIDDPIFSRRIYETNVNLDHLEKYERTALLESTAAHLGAVKACGRAIVSTPRLVEELHREGVSDVYLWRNAIDAETRQAIELAGDVKKGDPGDPIKVVYASGSRAHEADFRIIENALVTHMDAHSNIEFHVIGYLKIPERFARLSGRIHVTPFSDYAAYIRKLAECDIALVPLVADDFNDCKSAIRYMEASLVDTTVIATAVGDFANLMEHGENGYLANNEDDWLAALEHLTIDRTHRRAVAAQAHSDVSGSLAVDAVVAALPDQLQDLLHGR